jgi:hypothetical protein
LTNERLDHLLSLLGDVIEVDRALFGGSVAKHTEVDGLSDVDALVLIDRSDLKGRSPSEVRAAFRAELESRLPRSEVESVSAGRMAVTVKYRDGMEIQLLPAMRSSRKIVIGGPAGDSWIEIRPKAFQKALTAANKRLNETLVPAIKLMKSILGGLPEQKQLKGYHVEALAVDAAKAYRGESVPRAVLVHLLDYASRRVLTPISDVTGQSRQADGYLGPANSVERRVVAQAMAGLKRRLDAAGSVEEWKAVLED